MGKRLGYRYRALNALAKEKGYEVRLVMARPQRFDGDDYVKVAPDPLDLFGAILALEESLRDPLMPSLVAFNTIVDEMDAKGEALASRHRDLVASIQPVLDEVQGIEKELKELEAAQAGVVRSSNSLMRHIGKNQAVIPPGITVTFGPISQPDPDRKAKLEAFDKRFAELRAEAEARRSAPPETPEKIVVHRQDKERTPVQEAIRTLSPEGQLLIEHQEGQHEPYMDEGGLVGCAECESVLITAHDRGEHTAHAPGCTKCEAKDAEVKATIDAQAAKDSAELQAKADELWPPAGVPMPKCVLDHAHEADEGECVYETLEDRLEKITEWVTDEPTKTMARGRWVHNDPSIDEEVVSVDQEPGGVLVCYRCRRPIHWTGPTGLVDEAAKDVDEEVELLRAVVNAVRPLSDDIGGDLDEHPVSEDMKAIHEAVRAYDKRMGNEHA